jgi:hypothetical protein
MALAKWLDHIQFQKAMWVETTDRGDMPPTTFVFRDGECLCIITAPQVDRDEGLKAVHIARHGLKADEFIVVFDAHVQSVPKEKAEEYMETYKPGSMQKACDEEGACELGQMSDCLCCHWINEKLEAEVKILPYAYHGKDGGVPFNWIDFEGLGSASESASDLSAMSGIIPDALKHIMQENPKINSLPLQELANMIGLNDPEREQWHIDRALFQVFDTQGYIVQAHKKYMEPYPE